MFTYLPTNFGAYFKLGSMVASNGTDANYSPTTTVIFNPTATASFAAWSYIPYAVEEVNIDDAYHNLTNVTAGKGDPCRLVGYTLSEVKTMIAAGIVPDNKTWRLPTLADNITFFGGESWDYPSNFEFNNGTTGFWFPRDGSQSNGFLPAAGRRGETGTLLDLGTQGYYWSSSLDIQGRSSSLYFYKTRVCHSYDYRYRGINIRCVRQE